jgi:hypothetical protein
MYGLSIKSLRSVLCVGVLLLGLSGLAWAQGAPGGTNVQATLEELSAEHTGLATQIENVPTEAEMTTQHDMIKQGVDDAQTAIQADIAEVKALVEALDGGGGAPPCPVAGGTPDASGRYVTYEVDGGDPKKVCDATTGLFWEQSPDGVNRYNLDPGSAQAHCAALGAGWRVPAIQELVGVVDYTAFNPAVNTSVFSNVQSAGFWSASSFADSPAFAWFVDFFNGLVNFPSKSGNNFVWCARSGL